MKFGKLLIKAEDSLPDVKHLSLRYKQLKKQLKELAAAQQDDSRSASCSKQQELSPQERQFIETLNEDMTRFNDYFCDKEEEVVIWMQQLDEQCAAAKTLKDYQLSHIGYIHLHGQLVLLYHWSMLNYAALVKILKKHDKVTGLLLKARFLSNALRQPFSTTGALSTLMAECERKANGLNAKTGGLDSLVQSCPQYEGLFLMKETQAAFELWSELKTNVSTPSSFVNPPPKRRKGSDGAALPDAEEDPAAPGPSNRGDGASGSHPGDRAAADDAAPLGAFPSGAVDPASAGAPAASPGAPSSPQPGGAARLPGAAAAEAVSTSEIQLADATRG